MKFAFFFLVISLSQSLFAVPYECTARTFHYLPNKTEESEITGINFDTGTAQNAMQKTFNLGSKKFYLTCGDFIPFDKRIRNRDTILCDLWIETPDNLQPVSCSEASTGTEFLNGSWALPYNGKEGFLVGYTCDKVKNL